MIKQNTSMLYLLFFAGAVMLLYAVYSLIRFLKLKTVVYFDNYVKPGELTFELTGEPKKYSICLLDEKMAKVGNDFKIEVFSGNSEVAIQKIGWFKGLFLFKGRTSVEVFHFFAPPGKYTIRMENPESLRTYRHRLIVDEILSKPIPAQSYNMLIRETISQKAKVLIFVFFSFGIIVLNLAVVLYLWINNR